MLVPGLNVKIHAQRNAMVTTTTTMQEAKEVVDAREDYQVSATRGVQNASHAE